jgi:MFS family permease
VPGRDRLGIAILGAAAAPDLALELAALVFVGYGSITFNSLAKTTLQLAATPQMRGRVMALWALAWLGSTPVGGPIVGWAGQAAGARWSLVIGGLPTLACGILALPAMTRIDRRAAQAQASQLPGHSGRNAGHAQQGALQGGVGAGRAGQEVSSGQRDAAACQDGEAVDAVVGQDHEQLAPGGV